MKRTFGSSRSAPARTPLALRSVWPANAAAPARAGLLTGVPDDARLLRDGRSLRGRWARAAGRASGDNVSPPGGLRYSLHLPALAAGGRMPLVAMLHGCNQTAREFAEGTRMNLIADREGFAVLYPQQSIGGHACGCWNWYESSAQNGGGDAALLVATIAQVVANHPIDPSRVYVAGLSAGASMAAILAVQYPHLIAGVGLHSGVAYGAAQTSLAALGAMWRGGLAPPENAIHAAVGDTGLAGIPAVLLHGDRDDVVHPINLTQLVKQFKVLNSITPDAQPTLSPLLCAERGGRGDASLQQQDYSHGEKPVIRVYAIPDLDHAWSGGDGALPFNRSAGPDASDLMWRFFDQHQRPLPV